MDRVNSILVKANEFKDSFNKYEYLWVDDRKEFMKKFLKVNKDLAPKTDQEGKTYSPMLEIFKEQVILLL